MTGTQTKMMAWMYEPLHYEENDFGNDEEEEEDEKKKYKNFRKGCVTHTNMLIIW